MSYSLLVLLLLTSFISALPSSIILVTASDYYPSYEDCAPYSCGNSTIRYPFGTCGLLDVECDANQTILSYSRSLYYRPLLVMGNITESSYATRILQITPVYIVPTDFYKLEYDWLIGTEAFPDERRVFNLSEAYMVGTMVNCTQKPADIVVDKVQWVDCTESNSYCFFYHGARFQIPSCNTYPMVVPRNKSYNISVDKGFEQLRQTGFQITWSLPYYCGSCLTTGGRCYSEYYENDCICRNGDVHDYDCTDGYVVQYGKRRLSAEVMAGIFSGVCVLFSIVVVSCIMVRRQSCCCQRSCSEQQQSIRAFMDPADSRPPSVENFLSYYSSQAPARYSYSQILTYTNNLADKVGKGGFGTVYKGKLPNGGLIAVKLLDESKNSEQQFIAEVATVGTTCHVNLVRLLGYCSQGSKRALVYEYMVNGSLEKYIHGDHMDQLDWKQLYSIAVCTARGILYLHEECRNRILHCDIKPHNVLLDANFVPKVADFGLAKISDREESHISVANRGTLGYAAPEMWSRMYGTVTDRSDVYSYGMLVMELVGGRKNIDFNHGDTSSKFFFAEWAFKQVEKGEFGNLREGNMSEEDESIAKKLSLVGLWCIQFNASRRPSMSKVVRMLEGEVDIITPPFPFPVDTPLQLSSSDQSSSTYSLDIQMTNPASGETG